MPLSPLVGSDTTNDAMLQIHAFRQLFAMSAVRNPGLIQLDPGRMA
jgi:hypothetical protein